MTPLCTAVRRRTRITAAHGISPEIVVSLYPGGVLGLREVRRRQEYRLELGALLELAIKQAVDEARRQRRQKRRTR